MFNMYIKLSSNHFFSRYETQMFSQRTATSQMGPLNIFYQNVNGLCTKMKGYRLGVAASQYDIFVFAETRLHAKKLSSGIFESAIYNVHRHDRLQKYNAKRGGGVLVATRKALNTAVLDFGPQFAHLEQLFVATDVDTGVRLVVGTIYVKPEASSSLFDDHIKCVKEVTRRSENKDLIIIFGDYNLPNWTWTRSSTSNPKTLREGILIDGMRMCGLKQINDIRNGNGRYLDLIFTNVSESMAVSVCEPLHRVEVHHRPINVKFSRRT